MASGNPMLPPGGLMEIVFSFDTTGSMSSILEEVQGRLQDMIQRLQADIPGIRIGVIAHGDYCDKEVFYLTKELDMCTDVVDLCNFVKGVEGTGGGDADECYELILRMVRQNFSWTPASQKILVMIGDANPHEPEYAMNVDNIDWREEIDCLHKKGVKIYGVQAFDHEGVEDFYKTISANTEGHYLKLGEFSNICDFIMAICYRERGEELFFEYEAEVRSRFGQKGINRELEGMFGTLRRYESGASNISTLSKNASIMPSTTTNTTISTVVKSPTIKKAKVTTPKIKQAKVTTPKIKQAKVTTPKIKQAKVAPSAAKLKPIQSSNRNRQTVKQKKRNVKSTGELKSIHREKVKHTAFTCSRLDWSKWRLAYTPLNGTGLSSKRGFITKFRGNCLKRNELFSDSARKMALYEVAVQTKIRGKRHVVYFRVVSGNNIDWESALLCGGKKRLLRQIQSVIDSGCKVFVRRALVTKRHQSRLNSLDKYNYAWSPQKSSRKHRRVVRDTVVISGDRDTD